MKEILAEIKRLEINCPDCRYMEDGQYTCTVCWAEGGNGKINVFDWLKNHLEIFEKEHN